MNLVVHKMRELEHVDVANGHFLLEWLAVETIIKYGLARVADDLRQALLAQRSACLFDHALDLWLGRAVEDRRGDVETKHARGPAQVRLKDLPDVHARRHAERIQYDVNGCA